ncbi:MAG: hypothetical protein COV08_01005 [Candidatus Vogelbacteria bacterium CG10_big_fil_rev_8_21_14_0_10_49_38]|uniref:Uncharacterized protein n=1 Tax=Candidatus Vogelbacteria bacterium CG10_big_fil_rev_8_21_14_0_10_49_38 TaxID=1975043 RepID=A0A2H0RHZ7_9BACT|nr:MAG: hypothetical protein BK006_01015 [bacterium CG10_49_38]PIR46182.1 MAG: hypothetical protein COV08_01005 [Candidatus Vogelbacteria bacterium CG10_big_fil_rev_8_21_14_0_10_49_38]
MSQMGIAHALFYKRGDCLQARIVFGDGRLSEEFSSRLEGMEILTKSRQDKLISHQEMTSLALEFAESTLPARTPSAEIVDGLLMAMKLDL